jgi:hypothetical protein
MKLTKLTTSLVALMLLTAAVSGAAAAASFDDESTTTTTTSDVSGASTTVTFYPGNSSKTLFVETDGATSSTADNLTLELTPVQSGVNYTVYENTSADTLDATNGHYSFNVSHDELSDVPRDYQGGTYTLTVENSSQEILSTEVTLSTASDASEDAYVAVVDEGSDGAMTSAVSDQLSIKTKDAGLFSLSALSFGSLSGDDNSTDSSESNISTWSAYTTVNGTNSDVIVTLANSSASESYQSVASDYEDGDWMLESTMTVNGVPHKVYKGSAPDSVNGTTVVYKESSDTVEIDLKGDTYEDVRTVNLRATAGSGYGFDGLWSNFGYMAALKSLIP